MYYAYSRGLPHNLLLRSCTEHGLTNDQLDTEIRVAVAICWKQAGTTWRVEERKDQWDDVIGRGEIKVLRSYYAMVHLTLPDLKSFWGIGMLL